MVSCIMSGNSRRVGIDQGIIGGLVVLSLVWISGCGDFFSHKPIELQTRKVLSELREVKINPNITNPIPEMYRGPAKKINVKDGVKLFYFTKHHTVAKLSKLIIEQFDNNVSISGPTNQLIVHCADEQNADKISEFLGMVDVPPIQINIDCLILERFADVTMDWETSIKIDNLFGGKITLGGKEGPEFPGASLREARRATFGLEVGYWNRKLFPHEFRTVVDILVSRGYLKILMNPTLETVNGQTAKITMRDYAPLEMIVTKEGVEPYSLTEYKWVSDTLEVTPHAFADGTIGLTTYIQLGSKSKPEGVVQTSIITERSIEIAENRIKPGQSLVIGGIRKSEERAVVRGVPFLKDIPILGIFFSSKDFEEKSTEVIFILTPTFSAGGVEYAKLMQEVKEKYARPTYEPGLHEAITNPFSAKSRERQRLRKARQAEQMRVDADAESARLLHISREADEQAYKAKAEAEKSITGERKASLEIQDLKQLLEELNNKLEKQ